MSRSFVIVRAAFAFPIAALFLAASAQAQDADAKQSASKIAQQWLAKPSEAKAGGSFGNIECSFPQDDPKLHATSFSTTNCSLEDLWNEYAKKCGSERKYQAKVLFNESGKTENGSYILVERPAADGKGRTETIFSFRAERYSVSVTLRARAGEKEVMGTLVVILH
jgi:hypothetical protein